MLKFVLLFIAVTIAGTEEDCSTSTRWNLCFGIMKELLQVKDNQQHTCSLARKAAGCFEQSSCIPEKDWEYIIRVLAGCVSPFTQYQCSHSGWSRCERIVDVIMIDILVNVLQTNEGKEIICSLAKMARKCYNQARCVQRSGLLDIVAGCETDCDVTKWLKCSDRIKNYYGICNEQLFEQIKYCYPSNECDALYEMEEVHLKRACVKCRRKESKVCFELMDDAIQIDQSESFMCSLTEIAVSCFKAAGCPPMQNAVDIFAGCEVRNCDLPKVYKCRDRMIKNIDLCNEQHLGQIKPCYTNNECKLLFKNLAISLTEACSKKNSKTMKI